MKPNIVFITSDQQRRDSLGIYGCRYVSTPNLDRRRQPGYRVRALLLQRPRMYAQPRLHDDGQNHARPRRV